MLTSNGGHIPCLDIKYLKKVVKNTTNSCFARWKARKKLKILEANNFECKECKSKEFLTIDHIKPVREIKVERKSTAQTARWVQPLTYYQILCIDCHRRKNENEMSRSVAND